MSLADRKWTSLEGAWREFLRAGRNEEILEGLVGYTSATNRMWDCFEYQGRPARTAFEAFCACATGRSVGGTRTRMVEGRERVTRVSRVERTWAGFDLAALRATPGCEGLELPLEIYEEQAAAAQAAWAAGLADLDGYADSAQAAWYDGEPEEAPSWDAADLAEAMDLHGPTVWCEAPTVDVDESMIVEEMTDDGWRWMRAA